MYFSNNPPPTLIIPFSIKHPIQRTHLLYTWSSLRSYIYYTSLPHLHFPRGLSTLSVSIDTSTVDRETLQRNSKAVKRILVQSIPFNIRFRSIPCFEHVTDFLSRSRPDFSSMSTHLEEEMGFSNLSIGMLIPLTSQLLFTNLCKTALLELGKISWVIGISVSRKGIGW